MRFWDNGSSVRGVFSCKNRRPFYSGLGVSLFLSHNKESRNRQPRATSDSTTSETPATSVFLLHHPQHSGLHPQTCHLIVPTWLLYLQTYAHIPGRREMEERERGSSCAGVGKHFPRNLSFCFMGKNCVARQASEKYGKASVFSTAYYQPENKLGFSWSAKRNKRSRVGPAILLQRWELKNYRLPPDNEPPPPTPHIPAAAKGQVSKRTATY